VLQAEIVAQAEGLENERIAEERARAVSDYLNERGEVASERIKVTTGLMQRATSSSGWLRTLILSEWRAAPLLQFRARLRVIVVTSPPLPWNIEIQKFSSWISTRAIFDPSGLSSISVSPTTSTQFGTLFDSKK
jgi:hypothetical protein